MTGRRTCVVLGARNVSRGLARLAATVRARAGGPVDLFVAAGHGRGYGVNSRVWLRRLPSILGCGLWEALDAGAAAPPAALVTDVGNEILYGFAPEQVAAWARESVLRLADRGARVAITRLPLASIAGVGEIRLRLLRTLFVPGCRLGPAALRDAAARLDDALVALARETGAALLEQPGHWYGLDAIHVRRRRLDDLWAAACDAWEWPRPTVPPRASFGEWAALGSRAAEVRSLARVTLVTPQPAYRGRAALRVWLY